MGCPYKGLYRLIWAIYSLLFNCSRRKWCN